MNLFEEIIPTDNKESQMKKRDQNRDVEYEKLIMEESFEGRLTPLTQYFLAPFILVDSNGILNIPVCKNIQDVAFKEIAPHFHRVTKVTTNNQVLLRVQNLRKSSKTQFLHLLNNHKINAIVTDLYAKGSPGWMGNFVSKEYKVNLDVVNQSPNHDIVPMWNFFEHSFVRVYGNLVILPNGWTFDESFIDRIAVQSFASVCQSMTVTVNEENKMITSIFIH